MAEKAFVNTCIPAASRSPFDRFTGAFTESRTPQMQMNERTECPGGLSMLSIHQPADVGVAPALHSAPPHMPLMNPMTFSWVLKRAVLGIAILVVAFGSIAWLTYATIEHDGVDGVGSETAQAE